MPDDIKAHITLNKSADESMANLRKWFLKKTNELENNLDANGFINALEVYKSGIKKISLWRKKKKYAIEIKYGY